MTDLFGPSLTAGGTTIRPGETRAFQALDTFFKDCSSPEADDGTEFMAAWFNQILASYRALSRGNGNTGASNPIIPDDNSNDSILLQSVQQLIQRGLMNYGVDTGSSDALVVSLTPAMVEVKAGTAFIRVKKGNAANTTTTPTVNFNGLGPVTILSADGTALEKGELAASAYLLLAVDPNGAVRYVSPRTPATVAEAEAGVLNHRFISPATLLKKRNPYFVMGQNGGSFSLPSGVNTIIPITTDQGSYFSDAASSISGGNNRVVFGPSDAGMWLFVASIGINASVDTQINVAVAINGGTPNPYQSIHANTSIDTHMTWPYRISAGDYAQLSAFQNSGGSLTQTEGSLVGFRLSA
jgi:hypothetical protein